MSVDVPVSAAGIPEPRLDMVRDRALQFATNISTSVEDLLNNADLIVGYILNGENPFDPASSDRKSL